MSTTILGPDGKPIYSSGYAEAGASYKKRALKAFRPISSDAISDIDANNHTLRQRARTLYMAAPIATSAIRTNRTNVVGMGLRLKSKVNRKVLGLSPEEANELEKHIEAEFALWAENKRACDATGVNDFYAMQQLVLISWLLSGDAFALFKERDTHAMFPYSLRLHIIEADRISTEAGQLGFSPSPVLRDGRRLTPLLYSTEGKYQSNKVHDGVEVDESGAIVAYHICSGYPGTAPLGETIKWDRIEAYGETTGLPNILQIMDAERPEQYRGVPYLAHVIEPLLQLRRYSESELMASVVESFFTAFIKTETPADQLPLNETGEGMQPSDPNDYQMGPGQINVLKPGEGVEFGDPKRPASGFENFVGAMSTQIGAALEEPADLLLKKFNASYSASRAALLEAWKAFKMRRAWLVSDFCQPTFVRWMSEAVARGRIDAPGFFDDPLIRNAYCSGQWMGPSQGQLDPLKEVTAKKIAIQEGLTTRSQATIEMDGGSFEDNAEQLKIENQKLLEAGINPQESEVILKIREGNDESQELETQVNTKR